jgi:hypothetical protein
MRWSVVIHHLILDDVGHEGCAAVRGPQVGLGV